MLRFAIAVALAAAGCASGAAPPGPGPSGGGGGGGEAGQGGSGASGGGSGGEAGQSGDGGGGSGGQAGQGGGGAGGGQVVDAANPVPDAAADASIVVCTVPADCASGFCVDGYCCDTSCGNPCRACNVPGFAGTCAYIPKGMPDLEGRTVCAGSETCDGAGLCKRKQGETCAAAADCATGFCADGVCCDSACTEACKSCGIAGSLGTCTGLAVGASDPNAATPCAAPAVCGAGGVCRRENGKDCTAATGCLSGLCVDAVCCESKCDTTCYGCKVSGKEGTCSPLQGIADPPGCPSPASCESGTCRHDTGFVCTGKADCFSYLTCCAPAGQPKTCRYGSDAGGCDCTTDSSVCGGSNYICCGESTTSRTCRGSSAGCECSVSPTTACQSSYGYCCTTGTYKNICRAGSYDCG